MRPRPPSRVGASRSPRTRLSSSGARPRGNGKAPPERNSLAGKRSGCSGSAWKQGPARRPCWFFASSALGPSSPGCALPCIDIAPGEGSPGCPDGAACGFQVMRLWESLPRSNHDGSALSLGASAARARSGSRLTDAGRRPPRTSGGAPGCLTVRCVTVQAKRLCSVCSLCGVKHSLNACLFSIFQHQV